MNTLDGSLCDSILFAEFSNLTGKHCTAVCQFRWYILTAHLLNDFPPKRIRWCFYLSLINILLRVLPTSIPIFLSQIASLVLLALFIRAAYQAEKLTV